jgi:hypothetical protein
MVLLTVVRYPKWLSWAGIFSMAIFRLPLYFNKSLAFYKLMGSGKNGRFDIVPDLQQWALLVSIENANSKVWNTTVYGSFINRWWKFFKVKEWSVLLQPIEGHGKWDGKEAFGSLPRTSEATGPIAVLTRATIRMSKAKHFWKNVDAVAREMTAAPGFVYSIGIGETPWLKQATFSVWQSKEHMKQFAYSRQHHKLVIQRTRKEDWYSEDMFVRFKIMATAGNLPAQLKVLETMAHG